MLPSTPAVVGSRRGPLNRRHHVHQATETLRGHGRAWRRAQATCAPARTRDGWGTAPACPRCQTALAGGWGGALPRSVCHPEGKSLPESLWLPGSVGLGWQRTPGTEDLVGVKGDSPSRDPPPRGRSPSGCPETQCVPVCWSGTGLRDAAMAVAVAGVLGELRGSAAPPPCFPLSAPCSPASVTQEGG